MSDERKDEKNGVQKSDLSVGVWHNTHYPHLHKEYRQEMTIIQLLPSIDKINIILNLRVLLKKMNSYFCTCPKFLLLFTVCSTEKFTGN